MTKTLLVLHAACFVVLIGAATHNAVFSVRAWRGGAVSLRAHRLWASVMLAAYAATAAIGLMIYPAFRVGVRAAYLDDAVPLATGFFETKEHLVGMGLFALVWYFGASRRFDPDDQRVWHPVYHLTALTLAATVWVAAAVGLSLVAIKPL